jgi:site-specific recombinase XerD
MFKMSDPLRVQLSGPLLVFAAGFLEELLGRGYRPGTAAKQLQLMAHLSRWVAAHRLEPGDLREVEIERFVQERRATGRVQLASARALVPLLGYLRGLGVVPPAGSREAPTLAGALLDRYAEYLRVRRGLAAETVRCYCNTARAFLADRERIAGDLALGSLDVAAINDYLLRYSRRSSVFSAKAVVTGLRSLLRFLHLQGLIDRDLAVAVPSVANWRLASLVKALDADSVKRLVDSCDRSTAVGRRDFAILMLLSRLGLRIGEVAALQLEHVEWRAGDLVVCGKGSRQERLPLTVDVGEAITDWLRDGRPGCQSRFLFTRARAPHEGLHPSSLNDVVHRACKRAGLPEVGAHRLRHTAATEMLRAGSSLREVGQVLRHRSSEVTSIYAKVDRRALVALVQPWPRAAA